MITISSRRLKRVDVVEVGGRMDSANAPQVEAVLQDIIKQERYRIVLDMHAIDFLGSGGLRAIVTILKQTRRFNRGDLRLAAVQPRIKEVLHMAGLDPIVKVFDDTAEAVGSF